MTKLNFTLQGQFLMKERKFIHGHFWESFRMEKEHMNEMKIIREEV